MEYKTRHNEYIFKSCPFCGNLKWNFQVQRYSNDSGYRLYHCWACDAGGSVSKLKYLPIGLSLAQLGVFDEDGLTSVSVERPKKMVDEAEWVPVIVSGAEKKPWWSYFEEKSISLQDLVDWGIKVKEDKILWMMKDNHEIMYYLIRDMANNRWEQAEGWDKSGVVLSKIQSGTSTDIIIVEGLSDAIRVYALGYSVMILAGTSLFDTQVSFIQNAGLTAVFCLDEDVGEKKFEQYKKKLGRFKVVDIFEVEDPSDLNNEQLRRKLETASWYGTAFRLRRRWR